MSDLQLALNGSSKVVVRHGVAVDCGDCKLAHEVEVGRPSRLHAHIA